MGRRGRGPLSWILDTPLKGKEEKGRKSMGDEREKFIAFYMVYFISLSPGTSKYTHYRAVYKCCYCLLTASNNFVL